MKKTFLLFVILLALSHWGWGQLLLTDDFTGLTVGSNLAGQSSWTKGGSGPDPIIAETTALTYTNYNGGGGEYVAMPAASGTTSRVFKSFTATTSGTNTFYYSFLLRLSSVTSTGDYFMSLGDASTTYFARIFAKSNGSGFNIGISKSSNTATYGSTVYNLNQTYLIVVRYTYMTGTTNDPVYIWVNPTLNSEPTISSAEATISSGTDGPTTVVNVIWHNRSANNPSGSFDAIRVAYGALSSDAWSSLNAQGAPGTQVNNISFSSVTSSSMTISWTNGSGAARAVFMKEGTGTITNPTNGTTYSASNNWASKGTQLETSGYYCIYNGTDLSGSVSMSNLASSTTYMVQAFEYNGSGLTSQYLTSTATDNPKSQQTGSSSNPTLVVGALSSFGNVCTGTTADPNSFTINGTLLTSDNVTVAALAGFSYSTTADGTYSSSLSLTQDGGTFSQTIYVKFSPSLVQTYDGNIVVGGGGASNVNCAAIGSGVYTSQSVTTTSPATSITASSAQCAGDVTDAGCQLISARGICYGTSANPDVNGSKTTESGTTGSFSSTLINLIPNTLYHYRAYATSGIGTVYGSDNTFTTSHLSAPNATAASPIYSLAFTANWESVPGAQSYRLDVSTSSTFDLSLSENFSLITNGSIGSPGSNDISANLDTYLHTAGWTGSKIYEAGGAIKLSTSSVQGYIITKTIDLSSSTGNAILVFDLQTYGSDANAVQVFHAADGSTFTQIGSDITPTGTMTTHTITFSGATANSRIKIAAKQAANNRFYLDNINVYKDDPNIYVNGYQNLTVNSLSQLVTGLTSGATYYYRVRAYHTSSTSLNSNTITISTNTAKTSTSSGGSWSTSGNWSPSGAPTIYDNIVIAATSPIMVDVNNAICNDIMINGSALLTINGSGALTVSGTLTNSAGNGGLVIADGGSLKTEGTVSGGATVSRTISGPAWHQMSAPVTGQNIFTGYTDMYAWDEVNYQWLNHNAGTFPDATYLPGKGYLVSWAAGATKDFAGTLNSGDYATGTGSIPALTYTSGKGNGFNLMGNPYPSALSGTIDTWTKTNVDNSIWVYDNGSYLTWNGSTGTLTEGIIPAMQGFWVKANATGPSMTIPNTARTHSTQSYYKSAKALQDMILLSVEGNGYKDGIVVNFNDEATEGYDGTYDVLKMYGDAAAPQFFCQAADKELSIDVLPYSRTRTIPLGLKVGYDNTYTLRVKENTFYPSVSIVLEDLKTGQSIDLQTHPEYTFNALTSDNASRFKLHFGGALGVDDPKTTEALSIYANDNQLCLAVNAALAGDVYVYNMVGQLLLQQKLENSALTRIAITGPSGYYLVKVVTGQKTFTGKVFIR